MVIAALELKSTRLPRALPKVSVRAGTVYDMNESLMEGTEERERRDTITPRDTTVTAIRLMRLINTLVPIELKESRITRPGNSVITDEVIETAKQAGEESKRACIIFSLLTAISWYRKIKRQELYDADLNDLRILACQYLAKRIIESEEDQEYLFENMLCRRYQIEMSGGVVTDPRNALELAVDLGALTVIGSSGYQKCITWMWHGWIVQSDTNPLEYIPYRSVAVPKFWTHFDPDRIKTPLYQNGLQLVFSIVYLALYTGAVNTVNPGGTFDAVEGLLYIFTVGFVIDEIVKFYRVGIYYLGFWSVFNDFLYSLLIVSFVIRLVALSYPFGTEARHYTDVLAYRFLAFCAPLMWSRLLLYLDMQQFFGAMLVVLKELLKESAIFFVLLIIIVIGFLQGFVGLDSADGVIDVGSRSFAYMTRSLLQSPEFEPFEFFAPPFGALLNYLFTFVVSVLLLNVLIALFNSAYEKIYDNAIDEYLALFSQKTLRFVRAPDENVFVPPLNLIEVFGLILPFEWWMEKETYARLNDFIMSIVYAPVLLFIAFYEIYVANRILKNRAQGDSDDDLEQEWEYVEDMTDFSDWDDIVKTTVPHIEQDPCLWEVHELQKQVAELEKTIRELQSNLYKEKKLAEHDPDTSGEGSSDPLSPLL
ncbi:hypothetical protein V1511DRAFT_505722 [Dipodascopsis uninucleata]